jgi:hypothetical protein
MTRPKTLDEMRSRRGWYDPSLLDAVRSYYGVEVAKRDNAESSISIAIADLAPGMELHSNIETKEGILILSAGHHLSEMTLEKIRNFDLLSGIKEPIFVVAPESAALQSSG